MINIFTEVIKRRSKFSKSILTWSKKNLRKYPWREDEQSYNILIAEFLLRRTTSSAVKRIYPSFLIKYPSLYAISGAESKEIETDLINIGYYKVRAKMLKKTALYIINKYNGVIPCEKKELLSIPNIGPYTAGAILSLGCGKRAPMVDSNVERLIKRVFKKSLNKKTTKNQFFNIAARLIPDGNYGVFNLALIDIASLYCTYRKTYCAQCPILNLCDTGINFRD